ncbi:MAG: hypothetical protein AAFP83_14040 [Bacteroidota bacterium]
MKKLTYIVIMTFLCVHCNTETKESRPTHTPPSNMIEGKEAHIIKSPISVECDSAKEVIHQSPIHGIISRERLARYFPGITDTIKDLRIMGSEKINLQTEHGVIVSMLHNTGTFDQMILCTHDSNLTLIDNLYIGKATDFDRTSHTIEYEITADNLLKVEQVDWGFVKKGDDFEIDTVGYESYSIRVDDKGKIKKKH